MTPPSRARTFSSCALPSTLACGAAQGASCLVCPRPCPRARSAAAAADARLTHTRIGAAVTIGCDNLWPGTTTTYSSTTCSKTSLRKLVTRLAPAPAAAPSSGKLAHAPRPATRSPCWRVRSVYGQDGGPAQPLAFKAMCRLCRGQCGGGRVWGGALCVAWIPRWGHFSHRGCSAG